MLFKKGNSYEDKIPDLWKYMVEKNGKFFISETTIKETSINAMQSFLSGNNFYMQRLQFGAFIRPL